MRFSISMAALGVVLVSFSGLQAQLALSKPDSDAVYDPQGYADRLKHQQFVPITPVSPLVPAAPRLPADLVPTAPIPEMLRGSVVYVYSFLDIRDEWFGPRMMQQLDDQIISGFKSETIRSNLLNFKDSPIGQSFSQATSTCRGGLWGCRTSSSEIIPVRDVIVGNASDEAKSGAAYRMVVFPASFTRSGAWQYYTIRFSLYDVKTGSRLWSFNYNGRHLSLWRADEDSAGRVSKMMTEVLADLKRCGFI